MYKAAVYIGGRPHVNAEHSNHVKSSMIKGQNEPLVRAQHFCLCYFELHIAEKKRRGKKKPFYFIALHYRWAF